MALDPASERFGIYYQEYHFISKAHKALSSAVTDLGVADIWKLSQSAERDYTFFSNPHNSYFQADF